MSNRRYLGMRAAAGAAALLGCVGLCGGAETIAYVSSLTEDSIVRLRDLNADGDFNDANEATRFFGPGNAPGFPGVGSAQTILVLGVDHVLAGDGEESGGFQTRVYELRDLNGDGDAMDVGESTEFWDSILPLGVNFDRPKDMILAPDGSIYLADNNTINFDNDTPEALWRLEDRNADGDVNDPNEVSLLFELSPPGVAFGFITEDYKRDSRGRILFSNQESSSNDGTVFILDPNLSLTEFASDNDILGIGVQAVGMTLHPQTENPVFAGFDIFENRRIVELVDGDENGVIDGASETLSRFRSDLSVEPVTWDISNAIDVDYDAHGDLWLLDNAANAVLRFRDLTGDGDYNDAGEAREVYRATTAAAAGGFAMDFPRTIGFACVGGRADLDLDGTVSVNDLTTLLANFGASPATPDQGDVDHSGTIDVNDLTILLAEFGATCP